MTASAGKIILVAAGVVGVMLIIGVSLAAPPCDRNPQVCDKPRGPKPPTTTTTAALTTTVVPTTTSSVPPEPTTTTSQPATTTTQAPTTSTSPPGSTINLTADWMIHGHDARSNFRVDGNGHAIMVMGGTVDWDGFEIDNVDRVMFMDGAGPSHLEDGVISNSGVAGVLGAYPLHWHLNGDTTRGTVVDRVTIDGSANRGFVPHGSNGITIRNSDCVNVVAECVWWDFPGANDPDGCGVGEVCSFIDNSNDTVIDNVTATNTLVREGSHGHRNAAFTLGAGTGNVIRNSTAIDTRGGADCSGFHWPEFGGGRGRGQPLVWIFENNHAQSSDPDCHSSFVWQNDSQDHIVSGLTGDGIGHGAYANEYHYENFDVPYVEAHAAGWSMADGHVGVFRALRHRNLASPTVQFDNVTFDRFVISNASNGGEIRGVYVLNNTNLTCGDIEYSNVVSGTRVIIDGEEC